MGCGLDSWARRTTGGWVLAIRWKTCVARLGPFMIMDSQVLDGLRGLHLGRQVGVGHVSHVVLA